MKSNEKGWRREHAAVLIWKAAGFVVWKPSRSRFNSNDIWGLFDFAAVNKDVVALVQVKSNYCPPDVKQSIRDFVCPANVLKYVMVKKDHVKEWKVEVLSDAFQESVLPKLFRKDL